jgi:hypothetical protein
MQKYYVHDVYVCIYWSIPVSTTKGSREGNWSIPVSTTKRSREGNSTHKQNNAAILYTILY